MDVRLVGKAILVIELAYHVPKSLGAPGIQNAKTRGVDVSTRL